MFRKNALSVAILPGFSEGYWHTKRLRRALKRAGFSHSLSPSEADIVIAHSAGCYVVPPLRDEQLLVLINPTYWPGKSLGSRGSTMTWQILQAVRPGNQPFYQLHKTAHNILNLVRNPRSHLALAAKASSFDLEQVVTHSKTIIIRNQSDPWLTPHLDHLTQINPGLSITTLPGGHDDCWQHPEPYVNLLQSEYDAR
jgi:hypothetical protein